MKIEKVNDHQIRCTLTKADLADRKLKLSELAYGTEKVQNLFRDMMQQASYEFGFESDDTSLVIEAIPLSGDCIVLIITKVDDPDELDPRFSKFAPDLKDSDSEDEITSAIPVQENADDVIDLFKRLRSQKEEAEKAVRNEPVSHEEAEVSVAADLTRIYALTSLDEVVRLSHVVNGYYNGENSLYKDSEEENFVLVIRKSDHTPEDFNKICNIMAEYGQVIKYTKAAEAYLCEHKELLIKDHALQDLSRI